jgi:hypothetical protein
MQMKDPVNPVASAWNTSPTAKAKNAVERSVTALLDELAPERVLKRDRQLAGPVEQHRTPTGCVLQAADAAVSVSWFAGAGNALGELRIVVWHGTVQRRGAPRSQKAAKIIEELVLQPIEPPVDGQLWEDADGRKYNTASLAAKSLALLKEQVGAHT